MNSGIAVTALSFGFVSLAFVGELSVDFAPRFCVFNEHRAEDFTAVVFGEDAEEIVENLVDEALLVIRSDPVTVGLLENYSQEILDSQVKLVLPFIHLIFHAAALHNIQAIEDLANTTVAGIGKVSGEYSENLKKELENMKSGLDDILKYVMDMLKHRIQQQIDALEELKDAYADIIDLRKEALDAAKKEAEYEDKVADKVKQIAKLQEQINALSLDDSRDAQAKKIKLEEEMAELQKELADDQSDYAVDAQKEALDDMQTAYENEKDAEIKALEETISSYQKLYPYCGQHDCHVG